MRHLDYDVIFQPEPEGGFTVTVPAFPGCISYGVTLEEAKSMTIDAVKGYLASLKKHSETKWRA